MQSITVCNGDKGLHKVIRLTVRLAGDRITGRASQSTQSPGDKSPDEVEGSVLGHRVNDTANLRIRLPGLTPDATVVLELLSPSSYTMHVKSLGLTMMKVSFNKADKL